MKYTHLIYRRFIPLSSHVPTAKSIYIYTYTPYTHVFSCFSLSIHHIIVPCGYHVSITPHGRARSPLFCRSRDRLADDPKGGRSVLIVSIYAGMGFLMGDLMGSEKVTSPEFTVI